MSKNAVVRLNRKIRRNVGKARHTKLDAAIFKDDATYLYYRSGMVHKLLSHGFVKFEAAYRERMKLDLLEHGFIETNDGRYFIRGNLTLERFDRLFPKSKIGVVPDTQGKHK
jgi:hypothetical protein